jgi:L-alanine-DL-glutamate epimerase-like enolase superfamily enzyme
MRISRCRLHQLDLPFSAPFTHASASRSASDSLVVELEAGGRRGYGEAVLREYVGGLPPGSSLLEAGAGVLAPLVRRVRDATWEEARAAIETGPAAAEGRPLLGALEAALLDLHCGDRGIDVFALIGREPRRAQIRYGAVLPMMPAEAARRILGRIRAQGVTSVRIKLGKDPDYNRMILSLAREKLGREASLRADVNMAWSLATMARHLELCFEHGVRLIEDPAPEPEMRAASRDPRFVFVADETFVTDEDFERIASEQVYGMLNIRLSKNGGVLRSLALARRAAERGLAYSLGCHVGETGILSSLGRTAAALMEAPVDVDGSYDSQLLADNITTVNFDIGAGGEAPVIRDLVGYTVDRAKLSRYAARSTEVELSP